MISKGAVKVVVSCLILLALRDLAFAMGGASEPYSIRPDILDVVPVRHQLGDFWQKARLAHLVHAAYLLEAIPEGELIFLARDMEYAYDLARLATHTHPHDAGRVRLLNVSRSNSIHELLPEYLENNGLNTENARKRSVFALIDTGFIGSMFNSIRSKVPEPIQKKLVGLLLASDTSKYPCSAVFGGQLVPGLLSRKNFEKAFRLDIQNYEIMPRYTDRSHFFAWGGDHLQAMSKSTDSYFGADGRVSKGSAVKYMEDLKYFWENERAQLKFSKVRSLTRTLRSSLIEKQTPKTDRQSAIEAMFIDPEWGEISETIVWDLLKLPPNVLDSDLNLSDLGLDRPEVNFSRNLKRLSLRFPEKAHFLESEEKFRKHMVQAFEQQDWKTLDWLVVNELHQALFSFEFNEFVLKFKPTASDVNWLRFVKHYVRVGHYDLLGYFFMRLTELDIDVQMELLDVVEKRRDPVLDRILVKKYFADLNQASDFRLLDFTKKFLNSRSLDFKKDFFKHAPTLVFQTDLVEHYIREWESTTDHSYRTVLAHYLMRLATSDLEAPNALKVLSQLLKKPLDEAWLGNTRHSLERSLRSMKAISDAKRKAFQALLESASNPKFLEDSNSDLPVDRARICLELFKSH